MPSAYSTKNLTDEVALASLTATVNINGGAVILGGTSSSPAAAFTDTYTATGVVTTDKRVAIGPRDAIVVPAGLALLSIVVSATNTLQVTWQNTTLWPITPPASATWTVAVLGNLFRN